jgi:hypothetical protein
LNDVKKTIFQLDLDNKFIHKNIKYFIQGEFSPKDTTKSYKNKSRIKIIDNFVAHTFTNIGV